LCNFNLLRSYSFFCSKSLYLIIFSLFFLSTSSTFSQIKSVSNELTKDYFEIGADIGLTFFFGDIDEGTAKGGIFKNNIAYKFHIARNFGALVSINAQLTAGKTSGEKIREMDGYINHRYFKTNFIEYTFSVGINLVSIFLRRTNTKVGVYASAGIGLIDMKVKLYDGVNDVLIRSYGYGDEKSTTEAVIPIGLKVEYNLSPHSVISIQTTLSRVDTDKLDAMVGNNNRDYYNFTSIGYTYKIYRKKKRSKLKGGHG